MTTIAVVLACGILIILVVAGVWQKSGWCRNRPKRTVPPSRVITFEGLGLPPRDLAPIVPPRPFRGCLAPTPDIEMGRLDGATRSEAPSSAQTNAIRTTVMRPPPPVVTKAPPAVPQKATESATAVPLMKQGMPLQRFKSSRLAPPNPSAAEQTMEPVRAAKPLRDSHGLPPIRFNTRGSSGQGSATHSPPVKDHRVEVQRVEDETPFDDRFGIGDDEESSDIGN